MARTSHNAVAGRAVRQARLAAAGNATQPAFAGRLAADLGLPISAPALSSWETSKRTVPAAVLLAAARLTRASLDDLVAEVGGALVLEPDRSGGSVWSKLADLTEMVVRLQEVVRVYGDALERISARTPGLDLSDLLARAGQETPAAVADEPG